MYLVFDEAKHLSKTKKKKKGRLVELEQRFEGFIVCNCFGNKTPGGMHNNCLH